MVDYSRFDHIGSDSEDDTSSIAVNVPTPSAAAPMTSASSPPPGNTVQQESSADYELNKAQQLQQQQQHPPGDGGARSFPQPMMMTASKTGKEGRIKFEHEGMWDMSGLTDRVARAVRE